MSDVCKHCTNAGCLDACPTGALIRTEFETVVLQPDVCNGCGYCIPSCPFGVVDRDHDDGRAAKCTLCYDRLEDGLEPACAKACPTDSIQFGPYDELVEVAARRVAALHARGVEGAYLYGAGDEAADQLAGGLGAFFLLTEPPERYGLPAHADSPIQENVVPATLAAVGAGLLAAAGVAAAFVREKRGERRARRPRARDRHARLAGVRREDRREGRAAHRRVERRPLVVPLRRGHRLPGAERPRGRAPGGARAREGELPKIVQGPMMNPPVWTWEVPLYFWSGGIAAGSSFVALACDLAGDHRSAAVARKVALGALGPRRCC